MNKTKIIIIALLAAITVLLGYLAYKLHNFHGNISEQKTALKVATSTTSKKTVTTTPTTTVPKNPPAVSPVTSIPETKTPAIQYQQNGTRVNADGSVSKLDSTELETAKARIVAFVPASYGYQNFTFSVQEGLGAATTYSINYQSTSFVGKVFNISIEEHTRANLSDPGNTVSAEYRSYLIDSPGPEVAFGGITIKTYMSNGNAIPIWTSGKFVIRINPNLPDANQVIKAYLAKYPPNN